MDADQIEKIAKDANDTSTKAYNLLKKTLDGEGKTSSDIDELNKKYVAERAPDGPFLSTRPAFVVTQMFLFCVCTDTVKRRTLPRTWRNRLTKCWLRQRWQVTRPTRFCPTSQPCRPSTPNHWR